ncbi:putative nuclease HARBI1 [Temnothorax curvispinosus]|uniref:Putative nuclease HARBI1 n=1 Tax=Temnothorax curvispinosus TaxID=300111 RepID=A0A6J1QCE0_9HYME|nr:putative nuclease HARBI1 [Temnothorax curvispinosus]
MATPDSYRSMCVKFGVGKGTAWRAVRRVIHALNCLAPRFIKWPRGEEATRVIEEFERAKNFPGVIGAIDGSFIKIRAPKKDAASYVCRKNFHAIHLQAVCDARSLFTHCYAGHVGSVHDARVFRNSPIADFIQRSHEYFPADSHLIGDAAYTLHSHVMVPFRDNGHLTARQKNFNYCLSSTRMAIEKAFGLLKMRFRILLDCLPLTDVAKIPQFIIACSVMHNICILQNDIIDDVVVCPNDGNDVPHVVAAGADVGNQKRVRIMNELRMRLGNENN